MFSKCFGFVILTVIFLINQGASGFFVKHAQTGLCMNDTSIIQSESSIWGSVSFVELSNNCLDPAAQFRFRDNGAMLNLKRQGCLAGHYKAGSGYFLDMFYIYVGAISLDISACAQNPDKKIYRAITQTSWGGLSVYYRRETRNSFQTRCAVNGHNKQLAENQGIDPYVKLTTSCTDAPNKRFLFGSVTCYGDMTKNANCPKDQYMVVETASYRGLSATQTCGLSDDYSCEVDVTCLVKKLCDGQHECNVTVDESLFPVHFCSEMSTYLYFEYQCTNQIQRFAGTCTLMLPDKPSNLAVTNIMSRSADISWQDPQNTGDGNLTRFWIQLMDGNDLIHNATTFKVNKYQIINLTPYTTYEISVAAGNKYGFGDGIISSFTTSEEAPEGPPLNVQVTAESSSSLSVTWQEPEEDKRNGIIINYTVCISQEESQPCFTEYITGKKKLVIGGLNASTKYCVRVLASTKVGRGTYSESKETFANIRKEQNCDNGGRKYLVGIIVLTILLIISFVIIVYSLFQIRRLQLLKVTVETKNKDRKNSKDVYENLDKSKDDGDYEEVDDEQSTYTALKRTGKEDDDHLYVHLN